MKAVLALFLFIASSSAFVVGDGQLVGNDLDELVTEALEYIRTLLKKHDPYALPPMPDQHLIDTDIDFVISTSEVKISNADDFAIDRISNNLPQLKASFGVTLPSVHLQGNYNIKGMAFQKTIQGSGTFVIDVTKLVETGDIQFGIVDHSLQITSLNLDYSIGNIQTNVQGLNIEGLTPAQIQDLLNRQFLAYLNNSKPFISEKVAEHVKEIANKLMAGKSLQEIIDWLKKLVASTPDPPLEN